LATHIEKVDFLEQLLFMILELANHVKLRVLCRREFLSPLIFYFLFGSAKGNLGAKGATWEPAPRHFAFITLIPELTIVVVHRNTF